jgi:hypothetical protein
VKFTAEPTICSCDGRGVEMLFDAMLVSRSFPLPDLGRDRKLHGGVLEGFTFATIDGCRFLPDDFFLAEA